MSYTITLANGNTLAVVADQSFDKVSSSLTLIGKNVNAYGQYVNENFVGLLENFANIAEPLNPLTGQLWYDTSEQRLKVYSASLTQFKPVGSPTVFASDNPDTTQPPSSVQGDLWWNPTFKELRYLDGVVWYKTSEQFNPFDGGQSGWFVEQQADYANTDYVITKLYNDGKLLAAVTDVDITLNPSVPLLGTTTLRAGMTLDPSIKIYGTATNSINWNDVSTTTFIQKDIYQATHGSIDILNNDGLGIGTYTNMQFLVEDSLSTTTSILFITNPNEDFQLRYNNGVSGTGTAISLVSTLNRMGIFQDVPATTLDVNGDTLIRGTLTVLGTSTVVQSNDLRVTDKNIFLAYSEDLPGKLASVNGNAKLNTTIKKFGTASLRVVNTVTVATDYIQYSSSTDFGFEQNNWTIEGQFYSSTSTGLIQTLLDTRITPTEYSPMVAVTTGTTTSTQAFVNVNGVTVIQGSINLLRNNWNHLMLVKYNNQLKLYVNGVQDGNTYTDNNDYGISKPFKIGANYNSQYGFNGYIDEVRVSTVARTNGNFITSTNPYFSDADTVLLLHFNGENNSTLIIDESSNRQDLLDTIADGGGITLKGITDKTFNWIDNTDSWTSSENLDLAAGKTFKIGGVDVLTANSLGTGTQHAPGLVDLPVLDHFTVTNLSIQNGGDGLSGGIFKTPYRDPQTFQLYYSDLYILNTGTGKINLGWPESVTAIVGSRPTDVSDTDDTLVTKGYMDDQISFVSQGTTYKKTYTVTLDITALANQSQGNINAYIISYLDLVLPIDGSNGLLPGDPGYNATENSYYAQPLGARCNVIAQYYESTTQAFTLQLDKTFVTVDKGGVQNTQSVVRDVAASATATNATTVFVPNITSLVKSFVVEEITPGTKAWRFVADIA